VSTRGDGRVYSRAGSRFWWIAYYHDGKQQREVARHVSGKKDLRGKKIEATEEGRKAAEKFRESRVRRIREEKDGGRPFIGPQQERVTIEELLDALEADYKLRGAGTPQLASHLKHVRTYFGPTRAAALTAEQVDGFIAERLEEGYRPASINRNTQILAQAYKLAIGRKRLSSAPMIRHLSETGNARQGFFTETEFRTVLEHLAEYLKDFALFGYLTGWRKGEIASLRWEDVDADVIGLRSQHSKNREGRTVPLVGELAELLKRRKAARQVKTESGVMLADLVFHHNGHQIGDIRKAWATACKFANVPGRLFHDLRRCAVRNMVRAGVPTDVARSISGHKTASIFSRYNIVAEDQKRDALERTQSYLTTAAQEEAKRRPAEISRVQ
jgi:integrase